MAGASRRSTAEGLRCGARSNGTATHGFDRALRPARAGPA
jgi:hypothetical protein